MIQIKYLSKRNDNKNPWLSFGASNEDEYEKWSPEVCGIYCLKMIGDFYGSTFDISLYQLTMECKQKGGFKELPSGEIQGVFHKPLLSLAQSYGLDGSIEKNLDIGEITAALKNDRFVILSIDKSKVSPKLIGGHLVLVHAYDPESNTFLINDPEPILAKNGQNIKIKVDKLSEISNKKGLVIWRE